MRGFFDPGSVALAGVSPNEANLGRKIVRNLIEFDFQGILFLVKPRGGVQFGRRIWDGATTRTKGIVESGLL